MTGTARLPKMSWEHVMVGYGTCGWWLPRTAVRQPDEDGRTLGVSVAWVSRGGALGGSLRNRLTLITRWHMGNLTDAASAVPHELCMGEEDCGLCWCGLWRLSNLTCTILCTQHKHGKQDCLAGQDMARGGAGEVLGLFGM